MNWDPFPGGVLQSGADFEDHIAKYGRPTLVRRAMECPCIDAETRREDPDCSSCGGWGWLYDGTDVVEGLKVIWTRADGASELDEGGRMSPNEFQVTWSATQPLGLGDMFVHPFEEESTHEVLVRGHVDPQLATMERLRFQDVTAIERLVSEGQVYTEDVDFERTGRVISWGLGGTEPAVGDVYAVRYRAKGSWVVYPHLPQVRHDGDALLPYRAMVRRYDPVAIQTGQNLGAYE